MTATLKACPFCQSDDVAIVDADASGQMSEYSKVHCNGCLVCGALESSNAQAIAAWNRRADGWQTMDTAPQDGTPFVAVRRWPSGSVDTEVYRWEGAPDFWIDSRRHRCIRPDYQEHYRWFPLPDFASEAS